MDKKTLLAFFLIAVVLILMPYYMKIVAPQEQPISPIDSVAAAPAPPTESISRTADIVTPPIREIVDGPSYESVQQYVAERIVSVESPLYTATISNKNGGSFTSFILKNYKATDSTFVQLVDNFNKNNLLFEAISVDGIPLILSEPWNLVDSKRIFNVTDRSKSITFTTVVLGRVISKTLTFNPTSYKIDVSFDFSDIKEQISQGLYSLSWNGGLPPTQKNLKDELFYYKAYVYQGDELSSEKLRKNKTLDEKYRGQTSWVGTRNKYFLTAIIPVGNAVGASLRGTYETEIPQFDISIKQQINSSNSFALYLGPLEYKSVSSLDVDLEQTMSMGFSLIRPISRGVLAALVAMHKFIPNYGVVLIIFSILIKIIVYPLTKKSYQSMKAMSTLQPKLKALKEKHAKDPQKLNKATMALYKEEGVNPMGGCLPMLIQMPLLFALFQVFRSTIELRGEPFMLWITDLSAPDTLFEIGGFPINILPLLMAVSMFIQQKMNPTAAGAGAGQQKSMMYFMNIFFIFIFYRLPSGLNLYYTLFNVLTILQQKYLTPHQQPVDPPIKTKKK
ncbi:MAG: membrane protein insertase YidC [Candidatus Marinimicrobia bacterium]|nr:membrane protein insertase YidC [Candidatus Neomarinimicrobiota bacterium]